MARGWTYSFDRLFIWRVNSNGQSTGQLDPANLGTPPLTSHALDVLGPISATLPTPTYTRFEARGGGTYDGSATGGVEALGQLQITLDQEDPLLYLLARGGLQDVTTILGAGGATIYGDNTLNPLPFDCGIMLVRRKQKLTSPKSNIFNHIIYPLGTMSFVKPNLTQEGGVNSQTLQLNFDPAVATTFPWGEAFGVNQNWYNNNEVSAQLDSAFPYAMSTFIADAVATSFTLAFKPQYSTVTSGKTDNVTSKNGTPTAVTSISTTTKLVTLAAAGSALDIWTVFYPTQKYAV